LVRALVERQDDIAYVLLIDQGPVPPDIADLAANSERVSLRAIGLPESLLIRRSRQFGEIPRLLEYPALPRQVRRARIDLVHLADQPPPRMDLARAVITLHDLTPFVEAGRATRRGLSRMLGLHRLERAVRRAGAVVCVSESTANDAERLLHADRGRVVVSYPGVDTTVFRPDGANRRGIDRVPSSYILHVGVLYEHKNPEGLL